MKKVFFSLVLAIGMLLPTTALGAVDYSDYTELPSTSGVNPHKTFTVEFSTEISLDSVTDENFFVVDSNGEKVGTYSGLSSDQNRVIIAPKTPYGMDETYTIVISDQVESDKGVQANTGYQMDFTVSDNSGSPFIQ